MAILGSIRKKTGSIFVVIAIGCVVLLVGDGVRDVFRYFFGGSHAYVGSVAGAKIASEDYAAYCKKYICYFERHGKQLTDKERVRCKDNAWSDLVLDRLYEKEIKQAGIMVSNHELIDVVQGTHIDGDIKACFKDAKTGDCDKQKLLENLRNPANKQWWCQVEELLRLKRAKHKLHQLMFRSKLVTPLEEAYQAKQAGSLCDVDYLYIPFDTVSDNLVEVTDQQLSDYIVTHKAHYKNPTETRSIQYIAFPVQPDEKDNASFQKELQRLTVQFSTEVDPYAFAKQHTDGDIAYTRLECVADQLPEALAKMHHTLQEGMVIGPVEQNGRYLLYKVVGIDGKVAESSSYQLAIMEKKSGVSMRTRNRCYKTAQNFAERARTRADFNLLAEREGLVVYQEEGIDPADSAIGPYEAAREAVRWIYTNAKIGSVSPIFDLGDVYLLLVMTEKSIKGALPSTASARVYHRVYNKVVNEKKAEIILARLNAIEATTLEDIAIHYGDQAIIESITGLSFIKNNDKRLSQANIFVGKCFGLKLGKLSKPIVDQEGVFIAYVKDRYSRGIEASDEKDNQQIKIEQFMQDYYIRRSMEEQVNIMDKRYTVE